MRVHHYLLAVAIGLGIPSIATSQTATPGTIPGTTPGSGTPGGPGTQSGSANGSSGNGWLGTNESHWIASGFVGADFGREAIGSNVDFGGSVGYLWNNWLGGEFLADFAPDFQVQNTAPNAFLLNGTKPAVNSYMANAVGALPIGVNSNFQPFVSGGLGVITLRSDLTAASTGNTFTNSLNADESHFAGNIGLGVLAFVGNWGIRGDVRYFRAFNSGATTTIVGTTPAVSDLNILPGLDFWRANVGVALRW